MKITMKLFLGLALLDSMQTMLIASVKDVTSIHLVGSKNVLILNDKLNAEDADALDFVKGSMRGSYQGPVGYMLFGALYQDTPDYMCIVHTHLYNNLRLLHRMWKDFTSDTKIDDLFDFYQGFKVFRANGSDPANIKAVMATYQKCAQTSAIMVTDFQSNYESASQEAEKSTLLDIYHQVNLDIVIKHKYISSAVINALQAHVDPIKTTAASSNDTVAKIFENEADHSIHDNIEDWYNGFLFFEFFYAKIMANWDTYVLPDATGFYIFIPKTWGVKKSLSSEYFISTENLDIANGLFTGILIPESLGVYSNAAAMYDQLIKDANPTAFVFPEALKKYSSDEYSARLANLITKLFVGYKNIKKEYQDYASLVLPAWNIVIGGHGTIEEFTSGMPSKGFKLLVNDMAKVLQIQSLMYVGCFPAGAKLKLLFKNNTGIGNMNVYKFPIIASGSTQAAVVGKSVRTIGLPPFMGSFSVVSYLPTAKQFPNFNQIFDAMQKKYYVTAVNKAIMSYIDESDTAIQVSLDMLSNFALVKLPNINDFIPVDLATMTAPIRADEKGIKNKTVEQGAFAITKIKVETAKAESKPIQVKLAKTPLINLLYNDIECDVVLDKTGIKQNKFAFLPLNIVSKVYTIAHLDAKEIRFSDIIKAWMPIEDQTGSFYLLIRDLNCINDIVAGDETTFGKIANFNWVIIYMNNDDSVFSTSSLGVSEMKSEYGYFCILGDNLYNVAADKETTGNFILPSMPIKNNVLKFKPYKAAYLRIKSKMQDDLKAAGKEFVGISVPKS